MKFSNYDFGPAAKSRMYGPSKAAYNNTEWVYYNVVVPKVLPKLGVVDITPDTVMEKNLAARMDSKMAADHFWTDEDGTDLKVIQTRFRGKSYRKWGDFTVRYDNINAKDYTGEAVKCEYNHIYADIFMYGICNAEMTTATLKDITDLDTYVIVNLKVFRDLCKAGKIVPTENLTNDEGKRVYQSYVKDGVIYCPINENKGDKDTRFVVIDIKQASDLFPNLFIEKFGY